MMLLAGLVLWPAAASAQDYDPEDVAHEEKVDPNHIFDFVDSHLFLNNMSIMAVVKKDGEVLTDCIVAVYADDGIRGKDISDPTQRNMVFLTVYGDNTVPLVFHVHTGGKTYVVDQGLTFEANGIVGGKDPYVITLQTPLLIGDANVDGRVDADDVVAVVNHVLGLPPATFDKTAADVNNDGNITIADAVGIIGTLLIKPE